MNKSSNNRPELLIIDMSTYRPFYLRAQMYILAEIADAYIITY